MLNINAADVNWNATKKLGSIEASDIRVNGDMKFFNAYNAKTNKAAGFVITPSETERDRDQDVVFWVYRPTQDTLLRHPNLKGWKVIVYND